MELTPGKRKSKSQMQECTKGAWNLHGKMGDTGKFILFGGDEPD